MDRSLGRSFEFGPFRLETGERVLLREGQFVPLTPKTFETLLALVESNGRILDKEELLRKVWPDTFVEEVSLAKSISILRKALGGDESHHYIETIPRRGYRFVEPVREVPHETPAARTGPIDAASQHPAAEPAPETARSLASRLGWSIALLAIGMLAGSIVWRTVSRPAQPPLKALPLTSFQGRETQPAFSPDGDRIAFVWNGHDGDNPDIYVKLIGDETPLRLTSDPAPDSKPVWSPDGRSIAFLRQSGDSSAFYLVPALGGAERKVADILSYHVPTAGNSPYFSPDGKHLAIPDKNAPSEPLGIFTLAIDSGEKCRLTTPPEGTVGDHYAAYSPDGTRLAFVRSIRWSTEDLFVMPVAGGEPKRLTFDSLTITGLAWTPDSREVLFTSRRGGGVRQLWRVAAAGGAPERVDTMGNDILSPAVSLRGRRLAYTQPLDDMNIWQLELDASGAVVAQREVIASTFLDHGPDYSPDGRKIAFTSNRSGASGIWVCESDGSKPRLLQDCGPHTTGTPRWSPDGLWIAFDSRSCMTGVAGNPDIYVIRADGGKPRRLTTDAAEDVAPSWSRDGRSIYFGSTRGGSMQIWKVPAEGGAAAQITRQGGFEGFESADGKHLYYTKARATAGIWRVPASGGKELFVTGHHQAGAWRYWRVIEPGIYLATASTEGPQLEFFEFTTGKFRQVTRIAKGPERHVPGLAVSSDGRSLLYAQMDQSGSDLMMVEDFR